MGHEYKPWYSFGNVVNLVGTVGGGLVVAALLLIQLAQAQEKITQLEHQVAQDRSAMAAQLSQMRQDVRDNRALLFSIATDIRAIREDP